MSQSPHLRVSMVVPTYRRPDDLQRCLTAIISQTVPPIEVVVVARADDDKSRMVAEAMGQQLPIVVITPTAPGIVPAAAAGLEKAAGDIAVFIDDDAEAVDERFIERYVEAFGRRDVVAVGGHNTIPGRPYERGKEAGGLSWFGRMSGNFYIDTGSESREVRHLQGCNMAFRSPFPKVDLMLAGDGTYFELDLCLQAATIGQIVYNPSIDVLHHQTPRAGRSWLEPDVVENASFNLAYVFSKHTRSRLQRVGRFLFIVLVGQRKTWGLARLVSAVVQRELKPNEAALLMRRATLAKFRGWRAGRL